MEIPNFKRAREASNRRVGAKRGKRTFRNNTRRRTEKEEIKKGKESPSNSCAQRGGGLKKSQAEIRISHKKKAPTRVMRWRSIDRRERMESERTREIERKGEQSVRNVYKTTLEGNVEIFDRKSARAGRGKNVGWLLKA